MLIAFDIGNTNTVIGVYQDEEALAHWRIGSDRHKTADEYGLIICQLFQQVKIEIDGLNEAIISSVVPDITGNIEKMVENYLHLEPLIVGAGIKTGLMIRYENPKEVGADRIVNAVAGIEKYGAPLVLVDFGTATTFCAVNDKGEYFGGAIVPGVELSMQALFSNTAKLPKVELHAPKSYIGRNTVNAIQSGLIYGYCDLVDGMVRRFAGEMGYDLAKVNVIATGGLAEIVCKESKTVKVIDPYLTLDGLRMLAKLNHNELKEK